MSALLLGQSVLSGIFSGGLYALLGLGMSLSWRFLRVINLAHFAFIFLAAYFTYQMIDGWQLNPLLALLLLVPVFFVLGAAQQAVIAHYDVAEFASVVVTFGITVVAEATIQWIWTADDLRLNTGFLHGSSEIGPMLVPKLDGVMFACATAICVAAWLLLRYTYFGKALRAGVANPAIAEAFGVPNRRLSFIVAGAAGSLAALGGFFLALLFALSPSQIYSWFGVIIATVILGGLGNPLGILGAGLLIGVSEALTSAFATPSWAPVVSFTLMILVLLFRPGRV